MNPTYSELIAENGQFAAENSTLTRQHDSDAALIAEQKRLIERTKSGELVWNGERWIKADDVVDAEVVDETNPAQLCLAAAHVELLEERTNSHSTNVADLLRADAERVEREQTVANLIELAVRTVLISVGVTDISAPEVEAFRCVARDVLQAATPREVSG